MRLKQVCDALRCSGLHARYTDAFNECTTLPIGLGNLLNTHRDGDRLLQLLIFNEEFLVVAVHQTVVITSLPFVHTARRSYRLSNPVSHSDRRLVGSPFRFWKVQVNLIT